MPLKFPGVWRFTPPPDGQFFNHTIPEPALDACLALIHKIPVSGDRQTLLEHFKAYFCGAAGEPHSWSSSASWAETDLYSYAQKAAVNAPLFIEALYSACTSHQALDPETWVPDSEMLNHLLVEHNIGYVIKPPHLELREAVTPLVSVPTPPPTLTERAGELLQTSLTRSEDLLTQGRGREAVQESLWLLETVATAFKGVESETGTVEGKYFNTIVRDLQRLQPSTSLKVVLDWISSLHGYLSSPTGGAVRHGLDLDKGVPIGDGEARLFCNLIRSYLSYLFIEHQRLSTPKK